MPILNDWIRPANTTVNVNTDMRFYQTRSIPVLWASAKVELFISANLDMMDIPYS
jgi:hypothetical protein